MKLLRWQQELLAAARAVRKQAYAPYSGYAVGAAVRAATGRIFTGANVENASYGLTICAERAAVCAAVAAGCSDLVAVAVVTPDAGMPCGACRQVLAEFGPDMLVLAASPRQGQCRTMSLSELLPETFVLSQHAARSNMSR